MKRVFYIISSVLTLSLLASCDKGFENINTDPTQLSRGTMKNEYLFTSAQLYTSGNADGYANGIWQSSMSYGSAMMQHLSSTSAFWYGDKYIYNASYTSSYWQNQYATGIKNIIEVIENIKENEKEKNFYNISRILKVWYFQQMTDIYGDIPYYEAGLGYSGGISNPTYDKQQDIYADLLHELEDACQNLDPNAANTLGGADLFYGGDVVKWKKFAYSEMVRLGMRLSKVNPEMAKTWVQKAVAGGVMESNDDNALLPHEDLGTNPVSNPIGLQFHSRDPSSYHLSKTFVDFLQQNNDPRLPFFATVVSDPSDGTDLGNTDPSIQLGQPNGYDKSGAATDISHAPNWPADQNKYSIVNRSTFARETAPSFILTHAETQLLLAEAAQRSWITGSAAAFYNEGVSSAILQLNQTGADINENDAADYLEQHPYNPAFGLEMINTQYWVATFSDWLETWANWRRSGYPELIPVVYQGNNTNGTIPRRFPYPLDEATVNPANYSAAVANLNGGDNLVSRVWWDKP